jgi:CxxC motif-containing protein (DUF1111 family)
MAARTRVLTALLVVTIGLVLASPAVCFAEDKKPAKDLLTLGRELFLREWVANDSRSHGGDGLGPVFNDSSCVACHNLGGTGGAGPANKNVDIVSAFRSPQERQAAAQQSSSVGLHDVLGALVGSRRLSRKMADASAAKTADKDQKQDLEKLAMLHPGFRTSRSVVLHRFGTKVDYDEWRIDLFGNDAQPNSDAEFEVTRASDQPTAQVTTRRKSPEMSPRRTKEQLIELERQKVASGADRGFRSIPGLGGSNSVQKGNFALLTSQRNTTALFGVGLIDSIPDKAIEAAAAQKHVGFPKVQGRVARLSDGKIGRFGWKSQKASLYEFAMTACAVELGLNVPDHVQAGLAYDPDYKAPGFDMDKRECDGLVTFLKKIPAPIELKQVTPAEAKYAHGGRELFSSVGCAACHAPKLGEVAGIYSDLLLHDMGPELGDTGSYGAFVPGSATDDVSEPIPELTAMDERHSPSTAKAGKQPKGATRQEWRTPPLWGVRDSGPYLHDGRAETLEQAIAQHGGEAQDSSQKFFQLPRAKRQQLTAFLKTLVAPEQLATAP